MLGNFLVDGWLFLQHWKMLVLVTVCGMKQLNKVYFGGVKLVSISFGPWGISRLSLAIILIIHGSS
jgi:hypothetical protein